MEVDELYNNSVDNEQETVNNVEQETTESQLNFIGDDNVEKDKKRYLIVVSVLIALLIIVFSSFYWLYVEYFNFKSNENYYHKQFEQTKASFGQQCNEMESAINVKKEEIRELTIIKEDLSNIEDQYVSVSNVLENAKLLLANVVQQQQDAQKEYNDWNIKIGEAKVELTGIEAETKKLVDKAKQLHTITNAATINITKLKKQISILNNEIVSASNLVESTSITYSNLVDQTTKTKAEISNLESEKDLLKSQYRNTEIAKNKVQDDLITFEQKLERVKKEVENLANQEKLAQEKLQVILSKIEIAENQLSDLNAKVGVVKTLHLSKEEEIKKINEEKTLALDAKRDAESVRDKAITERDNAIKEKENAIFEKNNAIKAKQDAEELRTVSENARDKALADKNNAEKEKGKAIIDRDNAILDRINAVNDRDRAISEKNIALKERDDAILLKQAAIEAKIKAEKERDIALLERNNVVNMNGKTQLENESVINDSKGNVDMNNSK